MVFSKNRQGMVNHFVIPTFDVAKISALLFFLLVPAWLVEIGYTQEGGNQKDTLIGFDLLTVCWLTVIRPWDTKNNMRQDH